MKERQKSLERALEEAAKELGQTPDETLKELEQKLWKGEELPEDFAAQTRLFRSAIGEEGFAAVVSNPSLPEMIEKFMDGKRLERAKEASVTTYELIKDKMPKEEFDELMRLQFGI